MHPSCDAPDGAGGGAHDGRGSSADSVFSFGLRTTLEEFGVPSPPADDDALGRLAGLEFASALGIRTARRALASGRRSYGVAFLRSIHDGWGTVTAELLKRPTERAD
jgi:hypothetical protein